MKKTVLLILGILMAGMSFACFLNNSDVITKDWSNTLENAGGVHTDAGVEVGRMNFYNSISVIIHDDAAGAGGARTNGVSVAGVHTIEGIETESDVVEYKDGDDGVNRNGTHTAGCGPGLYNWRKKVLVGAIAPPAEGQNRFSLEIDDVSVAGVHTIEGIEMNPTPDAKNSAHASEQ